MFSLKTKKGRKRVLFLVSEVIRSSMNFYPSLRGKKFLGVGVVVVLWDSRTSPPLYPSNGLKTPCMGRENKEGRGIDPNQQPSQKDTPHSHSDTLLNFISILFNCNDLASS